MSINILNTRLEAINEKCEKEIKLKLCKFYTDLNSDDSEFNTPSPQVIEVLWFDLITEKEHKFISEITLVLNNPDTFLNIEDTSSVEKTINNEPEKYFTDEVMEKLEDAVAKEFKYGNTEEVEESIDAEQN